MKKVRLSFPQMMFVIATRAALAGGVALLNSDRVKRQTRRRIGWILTGVGVATTIPAAMMARRQLVA